MADLARRIDGMPVVATTTERDLLFPAPTTRQRVQNLETGATERWDGSDWITDYETTASVLPGDDRTVGSLSDYLAHNAVFNVRDYGATGDGTTDDRGAIVDAQTQAADASARVAFTAGTYAVASNLTLSSPTRLEPGAKLKPASGVTITINGKFDAPLTQCFDVSAGGHVVFGTGAVTAIHPEWFGAGAFTAAATNVTAIQQAILSSLFMTSLSDSPGTCRAPVRLNATYPINASVYLPSGGALHGGGSAYRPYGLSCTTSDINLLVLGRSDGDASSTTCDLRNLSLVGSVSATGQVGLYCKLSAAGTYSLFQSTLHNVSIRDIGGKGVYIEATGALAGIVYAAWTQVYIYDTTGNAVHCKCTVINAFGAQLCTFTNCGAGVLFEDSGGTSSTETVHFIECAFESLGKAVGDADYATGAYGFKSTADSGQYRFEDCYFEGNGHKSGDLTGCHIDVKAAWALTIEDSLFASSNNAIKLTSGGNALVRGSYFAIGANGTSLFWLDGPPGGSDYATLQLGRNQYATTYTDGQLIRESNTPTTIVTGFRTTRNYLETPARARRLVLRDGLTRASTDGALGYLAAKRILNNSGGGITLPDAAIGTIVLNTFRGLLVVTSGSNVALVLIGSSTTPKLVSQSGTVYTVTKDTASSLNIYHDAGLTAWVVQNTTGSTQSIAVQLIGVDPMTHADDGYFETQFA